VIALLAVLLAQLATSVRGQSQTWDEANHLYAGYRAWTRRDFGVNPEPPPLVKLVAALPLLGTEWKTPQLSGGHFKLEAYLAGRDFLYANDADRMLFRARLAAASLCLLLAGLVFAAAHAMFGAGAGFLALGVLVFEPNLLAHGALVTTDVGLAAFVFATAFAYTRYLERPGAGRLAAVGIAGGLALAAKHSGLVVAPMLGLLAAAAYRGAPGRSQAWRLAGALAAAFALMLAVLWAVYGFRHAARPEGLAMHPPIAELIDGIESPVRAQLLQAALRLRLLPEAYLYGLAEVQLLSDRSPSYLFGRVYERGRWFYFPAVLAIKSTLPFLALLALALAQLPRLGGRRERGFLLLPPALYLAVGMASSLNLGVRHLLPILPFLAVLIGAGAWSWLGRSRARGLGVAGLLGLHALSSAAAHPVYLAYANEAFGGPARTHAHLTDSNVDWGQQLPAVRRYLAERGVTRCWFAYTVAVLVDPGYYGIPCRPLPTIPSLALRPAMEVPEYVEGPVLISASVLSGYEFGPDELNPYRIFQQQPPAAVIQHGVFVFEGRFHLPLASALGHASEAGRLLRAGEGQRALGEARRAVALAPDSVLVRLALADVFAGLGWEAEARLAREQALALARSIHPDYQRHWIARLEAAIAER
jgi:4-amino-4-deoxy-L-arabinose transferase-like glycosyltransferase